LFAMIFGGWFALVGGIGVGGLGRQ
jgi:hypothetical protein